MHGLNIFFISHYIDY